MGTVRKDTPLNVVVPAPRALGAPFGQGNGESGLGPGQKKDSVELLLEGIAGPRPGRARTTPQTGGEASAVYHAEHDVHPGQAPFEVQSKVLVERPATPRAIPVPAIERRAASLRPALHSTDPTVVTRDDLRRRLVIAFVAGLLVVLGLFVVLRLTSGHAPDETVPAAVPGPHAIATPSATVSASPPVVASAAPNSEVEAPAPPAEAAPAAPSAAPSAKPARHRRHSAGNPAPASSADLGEFKTKF
jgi:hypothetical protein